MESFSPFRLQSPLKGRLKETRGRMTMIRVAVPHRSGTSKSLKFYSSMLSVCSAIFSLCRFRSQPRPSRIRSTKRSRARACPVAANVHIAPLRIPYSLVTASSNSRDLSRAQLSLIEYFLLLSYIYPTRTKHLILSWLPTTMATA